MVENSHGRKGRERKDVKGKGETGRGNGRKSQGEGGSERERQARERGGWARLKYLSGCPEFL